MKIKSVFIVVLGLSCFIISMAACASEQTEQDFNMEKERMIKYQLKARGIRDPKVLEAMATVDRHLFVPENVRNQSYMDGPLPIGEGQTISQPYIVAIMTELLKPDKSSRILEIGTGSGYQAAVLGEICKEVYSIEILEPLYKTASKILSQLGYDNIYLKLGDGFAGWPEKAPFNGIIVTCAPTEVPKPLTEQLAEGGWLVIPVGSFWQELKVITKKNGKLVEEDIIPVRFVPMTGKAQEN